MAKTKQCRDCKADIPKNAKKCMHCGTRQAREVGLGGLIVVLVIAYFVYDAVTPDVKAPTSSAPKMTAAQKAAQEKDDRESRQAWVLCKRNIMAAAKFPSSVDISQWNSPAMRTLKGGGYAVFIAFDAKNGIGNIIPQMARCDVVNGRIKSFNISNR